MKSCGENNFVNPSLLSPISSVAKAQMLLVNSGTIFVVKFDIFIIFVLVY